LIQPVLFKSNKIDTNIIVYLTYSITHFTYYG